MTKADLSIEEFIELYCIECGKKLPNHNIYFEDAKEIGYFCSEKCLLWYKDPNNVDLNCVNCDKELSNHDIYFEDSEEDGYFCSEECKREFE